MYLLRPLTPVYMFKLVTINTLHLRNSRRCVRLSAKSNAETCAKPQNVPEAQQTQQNISICKPYPRTTTQHKPQSKAAATAPTHLTTPSKHTAHKMGRPVTPEAGMLAQHKIDMSHQEMTRLLDKLEEMWEGCKFCYCCCGVTGIWWCC